MERVAAGAAVIDAAERLRVVAGRAGTWNAAERREALGAMERATALLAAARSAVLTAERDAESWRRTGDRSVEAWHGRTSGVGSGQARARMRQAEAWTSFDALSRAAENGDISSRHVDAAGRVLRTVGEAARQALVAPEVQRDLLAVARRMDAPRFAREVARTAARLEPASLDRSLERQRAERFLHLSESPDGTRLSGLVDRQSGRRLRLALEAASPRPAADDDRTGPQRLADALVAVADTVLSSPATGSGAAVRPHVSFLMTAETWAGLRAAQARRVVEAGAGRGTGGEESVRGAGGESSGRGTPVGDLAASPLQFAGRVDPVTDDEGEPVPFDEVARVLCDCSLTRIVVDAGGEPLDLGREQRTYTGAQRRAVLARDGACAWEGCGAPVRWCEVHHIHWWDRDDGPTSVENGVTLCRFHHHEVHRRDLHLARERDPAPERTMEPAARAGGARYRVLARDGTVVAGTVGGSSGSSHGDHPRMSDPAARLSA